MFLDKATELRARFVAAKAIGAESGIAKRLLREGEEEDAPIRAKKRSLDIRVPTRVDEFSGRPRR
jgi:hypothetical protein